MRVTEFIFSCHRMPQLHACDATPRGKAAYAHLTCHPESHATLPPRSPAQRPCLLVAIDARAARPRAQNTARAFDERVAAAASQAEADDLRDCAAAARRSLQECLRLTARALSQQHVPRSSSPFVCCVACHYLPALFFIPITPPAMPRLPPACQPAICLPYCICRLFRLPT